jgi:hypothetical protein
MPTRNPRHLAEHRLPWRLMLVAFGLTFAVLAAMVASAALVPEEPAFPSAVAPLPTDTTSSFIPADPPPSVAPSSASTEPSSSTTEPEGPPPGVAPPIWLAAQAPTTAAAPDRPRPTGPGATPGPPEPVAPTTTEPPPAPVSTIEPTTTTVEPTTTTAGPTTTTTAPAPEPTTTTSLAPTTTAFEETTTTVQLVR